MGRRRRVARARGVSYSLLPGSARSWRSLPLLSRPLSPFRTSPPRRTRALGHEDSHSGHRCAPIRAEGTLLPRSRENPPSGRDVSEISTVTPHLFAFGRECSGPRRVTASPAAVVDSSKQLSNQQARRHALSLAASPPHPAPFCPFFLPPPPSLPLTRSFSLCSRLRLFVLCPSSCRWESLTNPF